MKQEKKTQNKHAVKLFHSKQQPLSSDLKENKISENVRDCSPIAGAAMLKNYDYDAI